MNLRDVVKRFGKDVGLNIRAVRAYAQQLFLALSLLRKCNIMHADIKPDNIIVRLFSCGVSSWHHSVLSHVDSHRLTSRRHSLSYATLVPPLMLPRTRSHPILSADFIAHQKSVSPIHCDIYVLITHSRAVLGIPYDPSLDVWSVGCTLYELYTGKILLPGRSNNQMLLLMMELKGRFNQKMIKKAKFGDSYFDEMGGFDSIERDRVTGAVRALL